MSGIIGGAGSKSGVIGTTELEYEEGDWTPRQDSSGTAFGTAATGRYIRIGDMVNLWFDVSNWDSDDRFIYNLPFTAAAGIQGSADMNYNNADQDSMGRIDENSTKIILSVGTGSPTVGSSTRFIGHAQYRV